MDKLKANQEVSPTTIEGGIKNESPILNDKVSDFFIGIKPPLKYFFFYNTKQYRREWRKWNQ